MTEFPISDALCRWYDAHRRDLPWRGITNPYRIWLSEVILQQTRVAQGYDYYERFVSAFPDVASLAAADEDRVMKLWQGLGYYSRARNLHAAARQVVSDYGGVFPTRRDDLLRLRGVGPYTAAAVASFSSGEAVAVLDGNVYRVLSRLFDVDVPINAPRAAGIFQSLADGLLPPHDAARHNQAMMELGALCCTPAAPRCADCPVAQHCLALAAGTVGLRPQKLRLTKVRERKFVYLILKYNNVLWGRRRPAGDIWQGLYEYVAVETDTATDSRATFDALLRRVLPAEEVASVARATPVALGMSHRLTHQLIHADFWLADLTARVHPTGGFEPFTLQEWSQKAVPKLISEINLKVFGTF